MNPKLSKNNRTLDLYTRLCKGKIINKSEEAQKFGVDERSIQRDIDNIRSFLDDCAVADSTDTRKIIYDRTKKGFIMTGNESALMDNSEILAVSKILLESRAFTKKEITAILDKLVLGCVPRKNMKLVSDLIANEKYHYVELHHKSCIKDKLWEIGNEIKQYNLLEIVYYRQVDSKIPVKRVVQPVAVLFSEYYFYLNAYITEQNEQGKYIRKYDYPAIFRIDRIKSYRELGEKFEIPYASRFEEGEYRKRIQFMYAGELVKLQFRYIGENVEAILDRLPTAKIVSEKEGESIIEAEVYGKGILMWLLSQGKMVEVLKPGSFRDEMKETLLEMLKKYD
ncbi:MAG: WYL domain-containing protein [Lachnospiraceae bacterium]|nr:WYL domain-containing protein [Lachnospiraceae bacterium]